MGIQIIQRLDALWDGQNMELSTVMTIQRRPAYTRFCSTAFGSSDYPLNYYSFQNTSGTIYPLVDTPTHVYQFSSSTLTSVYSKGTTARSSFQRVADECYICDGTNLKKWDGTTVTTWGIAAPVSSPSLSFGTGVLSPTSGYTYVYCYFNSNTGHLSQASPASANTGALTSKNITVSYTASSDPQVNHIQLFRTDDGGGLYYFLAQVANTSSNYTDSTADTGLNDDEVAPIAPLNSPPPAGASLVCFWSGRLWVAAKNIVYFAMGPDCTNGVGEEAFNLSDDSFTLPQNITGFAPTMQGLFVFTQDSYYTITGTSSSDYVINEGLQNFGIKTPNALTQDGDTIYVFTSHSQVFQISSTLQEIGYNIRAKLAACNPSNVSITVHRNGVDEGLFISDGSTNLWRFSIAFNCWSPVGQPVGGVGVIHSIETSSGTWTLLAGRTAGSGYLLCRNTSSWTDDGGTYSCFVTVGSIVVGPPGSKQTIEGLAISATATGTYPTVSIILNEISGTFVVLPNPVPEPPNLPASQTIWTKRHHLKSAQTPLPQQIQHMQVKISFPAENYQGELLALGLL